MQAAGCLAGADDRRRRQSAGAQHVRTRAGRRLIERRLEVVLPDLRAGVEVDAVDVVGDAGDDADLLRPARRPHVARR